MSVFVRSLGAVHPSVAISGQAKPPFARAPATKTKASEIFLDTVRPISYIMFLLELGRKGNVLSQLGPVWAYNPAGVYESGWGSCDLHDVAFLDGLFDLSLCFGVDYARLIGIHI